MEIMLKIILTGCLLSLGFFGVLKPCMSDETLQIIDERNTGDYRSALGTEWRLVTDGVMGGVSSGKLMLEVKEGRRCLRLGGKVSLDNNGGFIQAALPLAPDGDYDASGFSGLLIDVYGNNQSYNIHLRTSDLWLPWQAYRQSFTAETGWNTYRFAFAGFEAYRTTTQLNTKKLKRIGVVAIGREFDADICIGRMAFYRDIS
jgi:hypothetical protein